MIINACGGHGGDKTDALAPWTSPTVRPMAPGVSVVFTPVWCAGSIAGPDFIDHQISMRGHTMAAMSSILADRWVTVVVYCRGFWHLGTAPALAAAV